jgi:hypothetical protein
MKCWTAVAGIISDSSVRVVHSGVVAIDRMVTAYLAAVNARTAEQHEGLHAVLSHFAWGGAIRLRSAGAHVLDRMSRMPAALQVRFDLPDIPVCQTTKRHTGHFPHVSACHTAACTLPEDFESVNFQAAS